MAQPDLPADAPVPYVPQPVQVGALVALGVPAHLPALAGRDRAGRQLVHLQEPLLGDQRLDHRAAAVAVADLVDVGLGPDQVAARLQVAHDQLSRLEGVHRTQTMVAFEAYSRHDLEALFSVGQ